MRKQFNLGGNSEDNLKLKSVVKRFNERVRYYNKKGIDAVIPDTISVKTIRNNISSRKEFNKIIRQLESFGEKTVKPVNVNKTSGIKVSKWSYDRNREEIKRINKERKNILSKETPYTGTMGSAKRSNLRPVKDNINNLESKKQMQSFIKKIENLSEKTYHQKRAKAYKSQYIRNLVDFLGAKGKELSRIIRLIPDELMYWAYHDDPFLQVQFTSDPLPTGQIAETIKRHWKEYIDKNFSDEKQLVSISDLLD